MINHIRRLLLLSVPACLLLAACGTDKQQTLGQIGKIPTPERASGNQAAAQNKEQQAFGQVGKIIPPQQIGRKQQTKITEEEPAFWQFWKSTPEERAEAAQKKLAKKVGNMPKQELPESPLSSPTLPGTDPAQQEQFAKDTQSFDQNIARMQQLRANPDPAALDYLVDLGGKDWYPLAASAIDLLQHYPGKKTEDFLERRLKSEKPDLRAQALTTLFILNPAKGQAQARDALNDGDVRVKIAAAQVLGNARDPSANRTLAAELQHAQPGLGVYYAWALLRSGQSKQGLDYLKGLSRIDSSDFSVMAMRLLAGEEDMEAVRLLYDNLYSRWHVVILEAARSLQAVSAERREAVLRGYSPERRNSLQLRHEMVLFLAGTGEYPQGCEQLVNSNDVEDRKMALDCLARRGDPKTIPALIVLLDDHAKAIREAAVVVLRQMVTAHQLPAGPDDFASQLAWSRWWLRQYKVLAAAENKALLRKPLGDTVEICNLSRLDFGLPVKRIRPGRAPEMREGAQVEIQCGGEPLLLLP